MAFSLITSDVHLHTDDAHPINQAFYRFLEAEAPQADALYLVGDLFERWVGDDIGLQEYATAVAKLSALTRSGTPVYLMYGNRDFLMGNAFCEATGVRILKDPCLVDFYGVPVLLSHGDQLCTDDREYQKMRRWFRNPLIQWLFLRLPKSKRQSIGDKLRRQSQTLSADKPEVIMDVNQSAVETLMSRYPQSCHLIHGHTHRPAHHPFEMADRRCHRWVLGDWRPEVQLLKISDNQVLEQIDFRSV